MIVRDNLLLLNQYLNEITYAANEDELNRITESYGSELKFDSEEDELRKLWRGIQMLGREIVVLKTSGTDASRSRRLAALTAEERAELAEVEKIIDGNRFGYHFQPIVNTIDGGIFSYEALMRPKSDMGMTPFHILKYAELTGRLNDIERATFLNVLNMIDSNKSFFGGRLVFINSIPKTKLEGEDFRRVGELLMKHSDTAVVELTEQSEPDENELNALKERYRNMDVKIAIDDYGTGYSNISNLLRYMPNFVKIDRSLLSDIQNNPKKRHFVREIIEFCHANGIMALAEGVETSEELRTVILMGADLIQGFYTARPSAEIVDSISYEIRQEIKRCQQERRDGKNKQVYTAGAAERIQLDKAVNDGYECILVGKDISGTGQVAIIGSPSLDTDVHIEIAKDFKGVVVLEDAHLSNVKNRPCIELNENCDVILMLNGENKLDKGGIRVPESAGLTLRGEGNLEIYVNSAQYFGIGNDASSKHGNIIFEQSGTVTVNASGQTGACIGSGLGGNTEIHQGRYFLKIGGDTGTAIGAIHGDAKLEISTCDFNADVSLAKGAAIGSVFGNADVHICRSSAKVHMGGGELTAMGTIGGENANILINDGIITVDISSPKCTCAGALEKNTELKVERAAFRTVAVGVSALPFGGFGGETKASFTDADTVIKLETDADIQKLVSSNNVEIIRGRTSFTVHGEEIALKISE